MWDRLGPIGQPFERSPKGPSKNGLFCGLLEVRARAGRDGRGLYRNALHKMYAWQLWSSPPRNVVPRKDLWSSQKPQMMNLLTGGQKLCADCHVLIWLWEF